MGRTTRYSRRNDDETPEQAKRAAANADLAYKMQRWPRYQFDRELKQGGQLSEACDARDEGTWTALTRELFGRCYGIGTERLDPPSEGAEWAAELHHQADAIPEWQDLQGKTAGDSWRSAIAASAASLVLADRLPDLPEEDVASLSAEAALLKQLMDQAGHVNSQVLNQRGEVQRRLAKARNQAAAALQNLKSRSGTAIRSALREACRAGKDAVGQVEDGLDGLGWGSGPGNPLRRQVAMRLANNEKLKQIAMLAGRLRAQARAKQKTKTDRARDEVHGVTKGDDLQRLLASEVGLLPRAATRSLLLMRVAERRALQYKLRGREPRTQGPIIFCIDTSGSMSGSREVWAKASALAMMEIARIQKRAFAVLFFGSTVVREDRFDPTNLDHDALLDCLEFFSGGGTDISEALDRAADLITDPEWRPGKRADVVLVTDGVDGGSRKKQYARLKEAEASLYTVVIDCEAPADIKKASASVVRITHADMSGANPKLDPLFTI